MKNTIIIITLVCCCSLGMAQTSQFRAKLNRGDEPVYLRIDQVSADIEGYNGDEIIIEAIPSAHPAIEQAAGLKQIAIPGRDAEDNIIKPWMQEDTSGLRINIPPGNFSRLAIKVPQSIVLFVTAVMNLNNGSIKVNNINSIDLEGILSTVNISKVTNFVVIGGGSHLGSRATGKVTISDVAWTNKPVMINGEPHHRTYIANSTNNDIEIAVPEDARANFIFSSEYGNTYANLGLPITSSSETDSKTFQKYFSTVLYKEPASKTLLLNGGGVNVIVESTHGSIYLKKQ